MPDRSPTPDGPAPTPPAPTLAGPRRSRLRWLRPLILTVILLALLPVVGYLVLTRTGLLGSLVLPALSQATGGAEVAASHVTLGPKRTIVIDGLRANAPGLAGPAAELASADRLIARVDWGDLVAGRAGIREIEVINPRLRVSRQVGSATINFEALRPPASTGPDAPLPTIRLLGGVLELGEHDGPSYRRLRELDFTGQIEPAPDGSGYTVALSGSPGRSDGINLTGRIDEAGLTFALEDLRLDDLPASAVPADLRPLFEAMDIRGRIASTRFQYASGGTLRTTLQLAGVSLNLPFGPETDRPVGETNAPVRMTDVNGSITVTGDGVTAEFVGVAADLPHEVSLAWSGLRPDAEFRCTLRTRDYRLTPEPGLLPIAPEGVRHRLASFSNPTALLDADVTIRRDPPRDGAPGEIHASGEIRFRDGVAAFEGFPYAFRDLRGTAVFDREKIELRDITGVSESGARLSATARIAPPAPGAEAEIVIRTERTPIDDRLLDAMGESRASLVRALFDDQQYAALLDEGLIIMPSQGSALRAERDRLRTAAPEPAALARLADIERTLRDAPEFAFMGECEAEVRLTRQRGMDTDWVRTITVRIPSAGMLTKHFPLPVLAEDVRLVISDRGARIVGGVFRGLTGGQARVTAEAELVPGEPATSVVRVEAMSVPIDARLIRALPDVRPKPDQPGLRRVLTDLGLEGAVSCTADVRADPSGAAFDVALDVRGVRARPLPLTAGSDPGRPLALVLSAGRVRAQNENVLLTLDGDLVGEAEGASAGRAEVTLALTNLGEGRRAEVDGEVRVDALDAGAPVERLVGVFVPDAAQRLIDLRRTYRPDGRAGLIVTFDGSLDDPGAIGIEFTDLDRLAFDAFGGRVSLEQAGGRVRLNPLSEGRLVLRRFSAVLRVGGQRVGALWMQGVAPLSGPWRREVAGGPADGVRVELSDADGEAPASRAFLLSFAPESVRALADEMALAGVFDAAFDLEPTDEGARPFDASGVIGTQRVSLARRGERVVLDPARARIELSRTGGLWRDADARAARAGEEAGVGGGLGWALRSDGSWSAAPDGTIAVDAVLEVDAPGGLTPDALAMLPAPVSDTLAALRVEFPGGVRARQARVAVTLPPTGSGQRVRYAAEGELETGGAQLDPGAPVRELAGRATFAAGDDGLATPYLDLRVHADRCALSGVGLTNGRARVTSTAVSGVVAVPLITADIHGGRLVGSSTVRTAEGVAPRYEAEFRLSGVPLAELLLDWGSGGSASGAADSGGASEDGSGGAREGDALGGGDDGVVAPTRDKSRGSVDGWLAVKGVAGDASSTTGRGEFVVGGGTVLELPLFISLMKASNLQVPSSEPLGLAEASFFLQGDQLVFDRLAVFAESIEVFGYGVVGWPSRKLDLRLSSRAIRRIPVLSRVIEVFRDELVTVQAGGTLDAPEFSLAQFTGTRRILERLQGRSLSAEDRWLLDAQRAALANRDRIRRVGDSVDRLPRSEDGRSGP